MPQYATVCHSTTATTQGIYYKSQEQTGEKWYDTIKTGVPEIMSSGDAVEIGLSIVHNGEIPCCRHVTPKIIQTYIVISPFQRTGRNYKCTARY